MIFTELLRVIITAAASAVYLLLLAKLMGKRQISQMNLFDYINGITIGSIAAELSTTELDNVLVPTVSMAVWALFSIVISMLCDKCIPVRRFVCGVPSVIFKNGAFNFKELKRGRIDVDEFLCQARTKGYFDISQIKTAVLEINGAISFVPYSKDAPVTNKDINVTGTQDDITTTVISDGKIQPKGLLKCGIDEQYLKSQIGNLKPSEVMLALCDDNKKITYFIKK